MWGLPRKKCIPKRASSNRAEHKTVQTRNSLFQDKHKLRARMVNMQAQVRKVHNVPYLPQGLRRFRICTRKCAPSPQSRAVRQRSKPRAEPRKLTQYPNAQHKIVTQQAITCHQATTLCQERHPMVKFTFFVFALMAKCFWDFRNCALQDLVQIVTKAK